MELQITSRSVHLSPDIESYVRRKVNRLGRYLSIITESRVEIRQETTKAPEQRFLAQVTLHTDAPGTLLRAEERGQGVHEAIDKAVAVLSVRVRRHKERLYERKKGNATIRTGDGTAETEEEPKVIKTKEFAIKPMSVDEATEQMELLGHDFFLFVNSDTGRISLVYRRRDGNYGLIAPKTS
ncbi:MAG: ribosome-associated translation inhibitor RaiA, partial [Chloroflexota bacterium]